jgi:hypothetical protein
MVPPFAKIITLLELAFAAKDKKTARGIILKFS